MGSPPAVPRRTLAIGSALLLAGIGTAGAGPGLFVRNADFWYKPPVRRSLHDPERLPARPPEELLLPFREADLFGLRDAGYLEGYPGPDWNRDGPCSRYQAIFLLGGLLAEVEAVYGRQLLHPKTGTRNLLAPPGPWGGERVRLVLANRIVAPHPDQPVWWDEAPDRYQAAGWVVTLIERLSPQVTFLVDPVPYSRLGDREVAYFGHPLRRRVKRAVETRMMTAPEGVFRGRDPLGAREWVRILSRFRLALHGYRELPPSGTPP